MALFSLAALSGGFDARCCATPARARDGSSAICYARRAALMSARQYALVYMLLMLLRVYAMLMRASSAPRCVHEIHCCIMLMFFFFSARLLMLLLPLALCYDQPPDSPMTDLSHLPILHSFQRARHAGVRACAAQAREKRRAADDAFAPRRAKRYGVCLCYCCY